MSESPYLMLRAPEVRKLCEERGLSMAGVKSVLLARLLAADTKESNGFAAVSKPAARGGKLTAVKSSSPCLPAALRPTVANSPGPKSPPMSTAPVSPKITLALDRVSSTETQDAPVIKSIHIEPMLIEDSDVEAPQADKTRAAEPEKPKTKSNGAEVSDKQAKIGLLRQKLLEHQQRPVNTDASAASIPASHDMDGPPGLLDKQTPLARIPNLHATQVPGTMTKSTESRDTQSKSSMTAGVWSKASATKSIPKVKSASASPPVTQGVSSVENGGAQPPATGGRSAATGAEERERLKRQLLAKQQELEQKVKKLRQQQVQKETVSNTGKRPFAMVVPSIKTSAPSADTNHKRQAQAAQQQRKWLEDFDSEWKLERLTLRKQTIEETKQIMVEDLSKVRRSRAKAARLAEECRATERQALEQLRRHIVEAKSLKFLSAPRSQAEPSIGLSASADSAEVEAK